MMDELDRSSMYGGGGWIGYLLLAFFVGVIVWKIVLG